MKHRTPGDEFTGARLAFGAKWCKPGPRGQLVAADFARPAASFVLRGAQMLGVPLAENARRSDGADTVYALLL